MLESMYFWRAHAVHDNFCDDCSFNDFINRPQPDKAANLKCTCQDNKIQLGDTVKHDIIVTFSDKYGNQITQVKPRIVKK